MTTIAAIRDALAARVATLTAVRTTQEWGGPFNVSGSAAVAVVEKGQTTYDAAFSGQGDAPTFTVTLLVPKDRIGQGRLDEFCDLTAGSATSVRTAVNGTLGGVVADARVVTDSGYRDYEISESETYLGCEFTVAVMT